MNDLNYTIGLTNLPRKDRLFRLGYPAEFERQLITRARVRFNSISITCFHITSPIRPDGHLRIVKGIDNVVQCRRLRDLSKGRYRLVDFSVRPHSVLDSFITDRLTDLDVFPAFIEKLFNDHVAPALSVEV